MAVKKFKQLFFPEIHINYQDSRTNIPALDGLRGIAIGLVILFHCFRFPFGWAGVDLFFVLSGFLISGILLDSKNTAHYYWNFWIRRILRIFPLYYLVLILILIPKLFFKIDTIGDPSITYWFYVQNWKFTFDGDFPNPKNTFDHFWSLAIEEQFYLIFPIIIRYARPRILVLLLLLFTVSSILFRFFFFKNGNIGFYVFTFSRIDSLSIGALLAYLVRYNRALIQRVIHPVFYISLLFISLTLTFGSAWYKYKYFATIGYTIVACFFVAILVYSISSFKNNFLPALLNNRVLKFLGKLAYGLYVYHWVFYTLVKPPVEKVIFNATGNSLISKALVALFVVLLSILTSYISYHFFEKRFLLLKNKLSRSNQ